MTSKMFKPSEWDASVQEATRRAFEDLSFNTRGDQVHLKHIQGHFGSIELEKALRGELHIQLKNGMGLVFYKTLDALIEAGWVLD